MFTKLSIVTVIILFLQVDSDHLLKRRRRFAEFLKFWANNEAEIEFAVPEKLVFSYGNDDHSFAPYDNSDENEYHGRPSPIVAELLDWDKNYDELGPTFSRLVGLSKDLLEYSDVFQSLAIQAIGLDKIYRENNQYVMEDSTLS